MSSPSPAPVTRVGDRYRLDERIGAGAMGAVWRATDELLNRTVAVKELLAVSPPTTDDGGDALEESRQRILREGRIGARLRHAHVISMFDVVVHDDRPWLVMEYLPSESLAGKLALGGELEPARVADIGRQVADGLAAAHAAGVVHRDVKPGNVLIADNGQVKLTDFGVSRAVDEVQLTRTGLIAGTPAFLSPEVARGQEPTPASDVFALGATLYAAVEGRPPFGLDDNAYALLHRVATGRVRPPERAGPLGPVIMWLLSAEPADRPTAIQARDALEAVIAGRVLPAVPAVPVPPRPSPVPRRAPATITALPRPEPRPEPVPANRPGGRRRTPLVAAALVVLALVGGIAAVVLSRGTGVTTTAAPNPAASSPAVPPSSPPTPTPQLSTPQPNTAQPNTAQPNTAQPTTAQPTTGQPGVAPPVAAPAAATDPAAFVQGYYALLPGNTDAAFAMLSTAAQAQSGGRAGYNGFYGTLQSVSLQNVRRTGANSAEATVVFVRRDGSSSSEPYRFEMSTGTDGRTVMESFRRA
jgi:serine/threonine protein kinase